MQWLVGNFLLNWSVSWGLFLFCCLFSTFFPLFMFNWQIKFYVFPQLQEMMQALLCPYRSGDTEAPETKAFWVINYLSSSLTKAGLG